MDVSRMPKEGDRFGNWIIERTLDKGGMGMVYLAYNPNLGQSEKVALKVLDPAVAEKEASFVGRFRQEASIVFKTHCENLVTIHDAGCDPTSGFYYIVMEYLGGGTLRDRMRKQGRMSWREALAVIRPVASALSAVARRNSVHRDIKPENIMFTEDGIVKLADFGIAKTEQDDVPGRADPLKTRALQVFGTPAYMSPEQMSDSSTVDARADIWSLGVVLFEMLAGVRPYPAKDLAEAGSFLLSPKPFPDIRTFRVPTEETPQQSTGVTLSTQSTLETEATCVDTVPIAACEESRIGEPVSGIPDGVAELLLHMCDKNLSSRMSTCEEVIAAIDGLLKSPVRTPVDAVATSTPAYAAREEPKVVRQATVKGRTALRIVCAVLAVSVIALSTIAIQKRKAAPSLVRHTHPVVSVKVSPESTNLTQVIQESQTPPESSTDRVAQDMSFFQPQGGTVASVLSQLDRAIACRPPCLRVSLSAFAQRKEMSNERYEQQLLVPAVERLRTSGLRFSLVPGPGRYGAVDRSVAQRYSCDLD